jgi:hypothetical protein
MGIVRESIAFTRQAPSIEGLRMGKTAIFPKIIDELTYDVLKDKDTGPRTLTEFTEKTAYIIDTRKLPSFYEENEENSVIMEILNEMLNKVLTFNPNKLEHHAPGWVNLFFRLGREEEIWANPKWINDYTFNEFRQQNLKRTIEETKKLGANKAFMLGSTRGEDTLEIWGIENGATNLAHTNNEPIQRACERGDIKLVKLLLASPQVDPTTTTADGKRYGSNETNFCIRRAAKEGHLEVVKFLLKDKRVNPASRGNWALAQCLAKGDLEMCKLLLTDQRVRDRIFDMNQVSIKRFENYRKTGQI